MLKAEDTNHGQSTGLVRVSGAVGFSELIRDGTITGASDSTLARDLVGGSGLRSTGASSLTVGISGVGAAKLVHEVGNDSVEGQAVVETLVGKINEVVYAVSITATCNIEQLIFLHAVIGMVSVYNSIEKLPMEVVTSANLLGIFAGVSTVQLQATTQIEAKQVGSSCG